MLAALKTWDSAFASCAFRRNEMCKTERGCGVGLSNIETNWGRGVAGASSNTCCKLEHLLRLEMYEARHG